VNVVLSNFSALVISKDFFIRDHMYLVTAATHFEMVPFHAACRHDDVRQLVTGIGPVETSVRLMALLNRLSGQIKGVVNFGVGGAYFDSSGSPQAGLLDICLAEREVLGDFGVCLEEEIERISGKGLEVPDTFVMDEGMFNLASQTLQEEQIPFHSGSFVTVSCTSGTAVRGAVLARQHDGICENMEGAAVARVCQEFHLPCLEIRCISNYVEDRDISRWKLKQACRKSGEAAAVIVRHMVENCHD
jgi:futalosine hydrolase